MSSSHQFAIMSLHTVQKNYHEVCANHLLHSAISSIDSGKGSRRRPQVAMPLLLNRLFLLIIYLHTSEALLSVTVVKVYVSVPVDFNNVYVVMLMYQAPSNRARASPLVLRQCQTIMDPCLV